MKHHENLYKGIFVLISKNLISSSPSKELLDRFKPVRYMNVQVTQRTLCRKAFRDYSKHRVLISTKTHHFDVALSIEYKKWNYLPHVKTSVII